MVLWWSRAILLGLVVITHHQQKTCQREGLPLCNWLMTEPAIWVSSGAGEVMHYILLLATASKHSSWLPEERTTINGLVFKDQPINESRVADSEVSVMHQSSEIRELIFFPCCWYLTPGDLEVYAKIRSNRNQRTILQNCKSGQPHTSWKTHTGHWECTYWRALVHTHANILNRGVLSQGQCPSLHDNTKPYNFDPEVFKFCPFDQNAHISSKFI